MKMSWYFTITWLIILIVSFLVSRLLLIHLFGLNDDSTQWWFIPFTSVAFIYSLIFVFVLTLSSVTIFLNLFKKIRDHWVLSLLAYSLIPLAVFSGMIVSEIIENGSDVETIRSITKFSSSLVLPHLVCTLIGFLHFRKLMMKGKFN